MNEARRILSELVVIASATLPVWRDAAIVVLAGIVIGCIWLYVEALDV